MKAHRAIKARINREPASAGSLNQGRSHQRLIRLRDMPVYLTCLVFASLALSASPASATPPEGEVGLAPICPEVDLGTANTLIGTIWGYAIVFAPLIAAGGFVLLILVVSIDKLRKGLFKWILPPVILVMFAPMIMRIITNLPGTAC